MDKQLEAKLKTLPNQPGVYFHKDSKGRIIYVGKAAVLKNRVRQYFHASSERDVKTQVLVSEISDTDWVVTESEIDALFLESEMIKRYKPRYNIQLQDDKSHLYVRLNMRDAYPYLSFSRQPLDDGAEYFGPFYNGGAVRKALRYLRRIFPYSTHVVMPKRVCLQYHLGLCPGVEEQKISSTEYKKTLRKLALYLRGDKATLLKRLQKEMDAAAASHTYELAAKRRDQIRNVKELQKKIVFSDREFMDISKDQALAGLSELLGIPTPRRIEGYDISHMQGTHNVASMVVATNGVADRSEYRKFKMRLPGNNDFAHMKEVISRRFSGRHLDWPKPDLLLIDGGKGQLGAALEALRSVGADIPAIGLAKRLEEIVLPREVWCNTHRTGLLKNAVITESGDYVSVLLLRDSHVVKLLQRVRDESHRFAVSYHTVLKRQHQTKSGLDDIPGIGPATRKKLIQAFGSLPAVKKASYDQIVAVIGESRSKLILRSRNVK